MKRYIALVDCDSFFVSCEQAVNPDLKGKPVCVTTGPRGCVVSRSREAKKVGVRMGMPCFMATKEFPNVYYIKANHSTYKEYSKKVMDCLKTFSPDVQIYSIDEAFIDLTGTKRLYKKNYVQIVKMIKEEIKKQTDIDVSIGLSRTKTLAKLASDKAKNTGGIFVIGERKIPKVLEKTLVEEIWGVGRNTEKTLKKWGVLSGKDFISKSDDWLNLKLGVNGLELKHELTGEVVSAVENKYEPPKSIQDTSAISDFTSDIEIIQKEITRHIHTVCSKLRRNNGFCGAVSVMLRTKDFMVYSKKKNLIQPTNFELTIQKVVAELLPSIYSSDRLYRSTGVTLEKLTYEGGNQLFLFDSDFEKHSKLAKCIDNIEEKFGKNSIKAGYYEE